MLQPSDTLVSADVHAEARELQEWWEAQGRTATITPLGQPGGAMGGGAAGTAAGKLAFLSDVQVCNQRTLC